ncbi:MAG: hypothetical protein LBP91_03930 [Coriobacteriales bacterium]|nr:hypothetical protein [Coriobacteriales bacterium]
MRGRAAGEETLDTLLAEMDRLVGLEQVKYDVHSLINFIAGYSYPITSKSPTRFVLHT